MRTSIYQIDAFTTRRFAGNPAAVMPMESFLADTVLQAIAAENNLAETAFLVPDGGDYRLRWFTPTTEVLLCGRHPRQCCGDHGAAGARPPNCDLPFGERAADGEPNRCGLRHGLSDPDFQADFDTAPG